MEEVWGAIKNITGCKNNRGNSVNGGVDRANQFNNFYNRFDHPAPAAAAPSSDPSAAFTTITLTSTISVTFTTITLTSTISVTFTTITLTSTISVIITTTISGNTKQLPKFPLFPNLHGRPSQETAEETNPQEGGQPGQSVPQNA
ncbi:hypothetical protein NFI96_006170 [Prochilodus magdalenae]|nr:hypothetical protein NFI96_006170 [Prochilodus magdalenae]